MDKISLAVDIMGADQGPEVVLQGCETALQQRPELELFLCGEESLVTDFARSHERCTAVPCTELITMADQPVAAVRKRVNSSLVVGNRLLCEATVQGFFSAGSTGACLAAATLVVGRIKGIARPALATVLPSPVKPIVLCDVGANADCKPAYLVQFGFMASLYMERVLGVQDPTVHLLNIGEEDTKGSSFARASFTCLKESLPNFKGNCEGRDLLTGDCDVVVTDGFTGNVVLKTLEGAAHVLFSAFGSSLRGDASTEMAAEIIMPKLRALRKTFDPDSYGAAPILGVKGVCMVGHGSSGSPAIAHGLMTTCDVVSSRIVSAIEHKAATTVVQDG